jgi:hypothetical protein
VKEELRNGRYALVRQLGEGSQGETWEAVDRGSTKRGASFNLSDQWSDYVKSSGKPKASRAAGERLVAIKAFRLGKAKAWKDVELAEREARTLQALDHEHLPKYVEHFEEDGALYLVMEKIEGESLAAIRAKKQSLPADEVRRMLTDIGKALSYLHGRAPAVVHRDIKPGNVIRRPDGSFALVDFGAVRDSLKPQGGSTVVGTFGYMAPEQFQGRASPKSDVYGAAATALAMLTGCEPEDLPHAGLALDVRAAVPSRTNRELVDALEAMLEPDPDRRAESIEDAFAARPSPVPEKPRREGRKQRRSEEAQARREAKQEQRELRRTSPVPVIPRMLARFGLLIAWIAVWLTVGFVVPTVLVMLSLLFGGALRRGAKACVEAAKRAQVAIGRASARLSGRVVEAPPPRLRVPEVGVRMITQKMVEARGIRLEDEQRGMDTEEWLEHTLEEEQRREEEDRRWKDTMKKHARKKHWGR